MRMILEDKRALVTGASVGIGRAVARAGAWSFGVTHHEVREDEVVVLGKLTAEGIAKMQFGVRGEQFEPQPDVALVGQPAHLRRVAVDGGSAVTSRLVGGLCDNPRGRLLGGVG